MLLVKVYSIPYSNSNFQYKNIQITMNIYKIIIV